MEINYASKEVNIKIVYYGPGLSGKTTNLEVIHQKTPQGNRGKLTALATDQDRTLFFDYMPVEIGEIGGLKVRLRLFTVPGQVYYNMTRKIVLRSADGIVFVADSQENMLEENIASLNNLRENLQEHGVKIEQTPLVMQFNKRDLPNILPLEKLEEALNSELQVPTFPAVATRGSGIFPCLKFVANLVLAQVEKNIKRKPIERAKTKVAAKKSFPTFPQQSSYPTPAKNTETPSSPTAKKQGQSRFTSQRNWQGGDPLAKNPNQLLRKKLRDLREQREQKKIFGKKEN